MTEIVVCLLELTFAGSIAKKTASRGCKLSRAKAPTLAQ